MSKTARHKISVAAQAIGEHTLTEKDFDRDLKIEEALPTNIKELERLKFQAEKSTGLETIAINKIIAEKAK